MDIRRLIRIAVAQRGVALPMALMTMLIIGSLVVAFSVLSASEPTIASNHLRVAQARGAAEAGVERTLWALTNSAATGGLADPLPSPVPAPYDGSQLVALTVGGAQVGGFRMTVTPGAASNERNLVTVGWVPTDLTSDSRTKAHQRITTTLTKIKTIDPPCALCVRGNLEVSGNTAIDSRPDTSCGNKYGTWTTGATTITDAAADIWGADGNSIRNQATDMQVNQPTADFDAFAYTNNDLDILRAIAKANGTYYQGTVAFDASNRMPNGIIFVDTTTGSNITDSTPLSEFAQLSIHGNAPADSSGIFSGWIIVNGSINISGTYRMRGMVYAVNDMSYTATGTGVIEGLVVTQNVRFTSSTTVDTNTTGQSTIVYNCNYARTGAGQIPQGWFVKAGTYREVAD